MADNMTVMAVRVESLAESPRDAVVTIVGGTGPLGRGLATRWASSGVHVRVASRDAARARAVAIAISPSVQGFAHREALAGCDVAVLAVPWAAMAETLNGCRDELAGKLVVSCVNPLGFDNHGPFPLSVPEGSAVEFASLHLPESTVVGAFHHLSSESLLDPAVPSIECDVLVVGEDRQAISATIAVAELIPGVRGYYAGRSRNAGQVEALTANLIAVNRRYQVQSGIRLSGIAERQL